MISTFDILVKFYEVLSKINLHLVTIFKYIIIQLNSKLRNRIGVAMVSVLTSSTVDCGFELWSGQTKDYKICIY